MELSDATPATVAMYRSNTSCNIKQYGVTIYIQHWCGSIPRLAWDESSDGVESCDVESCDVESCDVESCDVESCGVESCDVESCGVESCDVESCDVELKLNGKHFVIYTIIYSSHSDSTEKFVVKMTELLQHKSVKNKNLIISGDLNIINK